MNKSHKESLRRTLIRMAERNFSREEVIKILKDTGTPRLPEVEMLLDEYFPKSDW